jgi:hypothetical protein
MPIALCLKRFIRDSIRSPVLAATLLLVPLSAWPQSALRPIDQAVSVPDFFAFRAQLQTALARRDGQAVMSVLASEVRLSFGSEEGLDDFKRLWRPDLPNSPLWETLSAVLALGGAFDADGTFTAPYVFTHWPNDKEAAGHVVALGAAVRVHAAARAEAAVVGVLDFEIVELTEAPEPQARWVQVKTATHRSGFVDGRWVRSATDYRVTFAKRDGRWQVILFLAGD